MDDALLLITLMALILIGITTLIVIIYNRIKRHQNIYDEQNIYDVIKLNKTKKYNFILPTYHSIDTMDLQFVQSTSSMIGSPSLS